MTTIVFDVNETVLDLAPLDAVFEAIFGNAALRGDWFKLVLHTSMVVTHTGRSRSLNFSDVVRIALETLVMKENLTLTEAHRSQVGETIRNLPPHADAVEGIERLHDAGVRLAALTNSVQHVVDFQLEAAGLSQYFDKIMSVEPVGKFKPAPEVYQYGQQGLNEDADKLWLVAAHDWDIEGAMAAGWHGAFIQRAGKIYHPDAPPPDTIQPTISAFAGWYLAQS